MKNLKKVFGALSTKFLGGKVISTVGTVKGETAIGVTADLQKSTGEIRVHLVSSQESALVVTVELVQVQVPGDGNNLACIRLPVSEAARLGGMLQQAADDAIQHGDATDGA